MGQSTNGVLFYGYCWSEERTPFPADDADWTEATRALAVEVDSHCSADCPMPFIAAVGSKRLAYRGRPVRLALDALTVDPLWDVALERFVAELGIAKPHDKPGWWLVSDWN